MTPYKKAGFDELSLFSEHGEVWYLRLPQLDSITGSVGLSNVEGDALPFSPDSLTELPKDADGYYLWSGGECPVPGDWSIRAKRAGLGYISGSASILSWDTITAFKPISRPDMTVHQPASFNNNEQPEYVNSPEYTGSSVSYYRVNVDNPTTLKEPYHAECNDIIEALGMTFAEGNAFKAIWRRCAARQGKVKQGYTDGLYDAEKVVFFGQRMVEMEARK